ncbi:hypothetical protein [Sulfurihydrogenibium sp.]|jgi:hypothetical protein|uniref:hypothetical protein n=1 Tax=Sulfurihydrogenibium sp. TaxID=2053621 RepID=UPI0026352082|nr:hypothetical protein [Sulfurihydrogenibium sp.]
MDTNHEQLGAFGSVARSECSKINKMGNLYARKILYMAQLSAIWFNKYCIRFLHLTFNMKHLRRISYFC